MPYTLENNKILHDPKCYDFECLLCAKYIFSALTERGGAHLATVIQLTRGEGRVEMQAVWRPSLCSLLTLSSLLENVSHSDRFAAAQPVATRQHSAPLTTFAGQWPGVSGKPWGLIPGFVKPGHPFSDHTRSRVAKPVQVVPGREFSPRILENSSLGGHRTQLCPQQ